ncbi:MAG: hypothetical protein CBC00_03290 [Verrucomicrobia bacterium TMED40]|nr:MAG: hypothetical protein CBC00_03290 [Verrucomicrobia bacterium TMED40]
MQILLLGDLARRPEGRIKKLPMAPEVLMKFRRLVLFMAWGFLVGCNKWFGFNDLLGEIDKEIS